MKFYKVTGVRPVLDHAPGEEFSADLSGEVEAVLLEQRRLELVPSAYRVVGHRTVFDVEPGNVGLFALTVPQEQSLIEAGHIEPEPKSKPAKPAKPKE